MWFLPPRAPHAVLPSRSTTTRAPWWPSLVVGLVVAATWSSVAIHVHLALGTGMDLTIFDQAVRALSHGQVPVSSMKALGMNLWDDHFHPVLVLAAPAYWLWDDPRMLLVVQSAAIGLACALLVRTALRLLPGRVATAVLLGLALGSGPGVAFGATFDMHEVALGMPLVALACDALLRERWRRLLLWGLALLLVKEDAGILAFGLGAVAVLRAGGVSRPAEARRAGASLVIAAVTWTLLVVEVVIPALSPAGRWAYAGAVGGPAAMLASAVRALVSPGTLAVTVLVLVASTGFLAARSALALAVVPCLLSRAASGNPAYWGLAFHYDLLVAVVLAFAALDAMRRGRGGSRSVVLLAVALVVSVVAGPGVRAVTRPADPVKVACARTVVAHVPAGANVAADVYLTPQLSPGHILTQQLRPTSTATGVAWRDDLGADLHPDVVVLDHTTTSQGGAGRWVPQARAWAVSRGMATTLRCGDLEVLEFPGR